MKTTSLLAITLALTAFASAIQAAPLINAPDWRTQIWGKCPEALEGDAEEIFVAVDELLKKNSTLEAAEVARNCAAFSSQLDLDILSPVSETLSRQLNQILSGKIQAVMEAMIHQCKKRYEGQGTSGLSSAAHCELKVLLGFDAAYGKRDF